MVIPRTPQTVGWSNQHTAPSGNIPLLKLRSHKSPTARSKAKDGMPVRMLVTGDGFRRQSILTSSNRHEPSIRKLAMLLGSFQTKCNFEMHVVDYFSGDHRIGAIHDRIFGESSDAARWAYRSQVLNDAVQDFYRFLTHNIDVAVTFECGESFYRYCEENGIPLLDISFHYTRYGSDYHLMARTTCKRFELALNSVERDVTTISPFERYTYDRAEKAAKALGSLQRDDEITSIFAIQTRFDRSKFDGCGGLLDELAIIQQAAPECHFYKVHPLNHRPEVEVCLANLGMKQLPTTIDIYGALAASSDTVSITGLSSGLIAEAIDLGSSSSRMIVGFPWKIRQSIEYTRSSNVFDGCYVPVSAKLITKDFWNAALHGQNLLNPDGLPEPILSLKDFWNVKWS